MLLRLHTGLGTGHGQTACPRLVFRLPGGDRLRRLAARAAAQNGPHGSSNGDWRSLPKASGQEDDLQAYATGGGPDPPPLPSTQQPSSSASQHDAPAASAPSAPSASSADPPATPSADGEASDDDMVYVDAEANDDEELGQLESLEQYNARGGMFVRYSGDAATASAAQQRWNVVHPYIDCCTHVSANLWLDREEVYVIIFGVGDRSVHSEGIYSMRETTEQGVVQETIVAFEAFEDAERYATLLEATMQSEVFRQPTICTMGQEELLAFCEEVGYHARLEPAGSLALPPDMNVPITDWERSMKLRAGDYQVLDHEPTYGATTLGGNTSKAASSAGASSPTRPAAGAGSQGGSGGAGRQQRQQYPSGTRMQTYMGDEEQLDMVGRLQKLFEGEEAPGESAGNEDGGVWDPAGGVARHAVNSPNWEPPPPEVKMPAPGEDMDKYKLHLETLLPSSRLWASPPGGAAAAAAPQAAGSDASKSSGGCASAGSGAAGQLPAPEEADEDVSTGASQAVRDWKETRAQLDAFFASGSGIAAPEGAQPPSRPKSPTPDSTPPPELASSEETATPAEPAASAAAPAASAPSSAVQRPKVRAPRARIAPLDMGSPFASEQTEMAAMAAQQHGKPTWVTDGQGGRVILANGKVYREEAPQPLVYGTIREMMLNCSAWREGGASDCDSDSECVVPPPDFGWE